MSEGINRILNSLTYNHPRSFDTAPRIYLASAPSSHCSEHSSRPPVVMDHYESSENLREFESFKKESILVVNGRSDYIDRVLYSFAIPHRKISPAEISDVLLREALAVFVNCCDEFPSHAARQLAPFVLEGGLLLTTDRAVKSVLEIGFPRMIQHNGKETGEWILRDTPISWYIRTESYPIMEMDSRVEIILESEEFRKEYGNGSLYVRFPFGHGMVHHLVSELYTQNPETQKRLLIQILANQKNKTKIVDASKIQIMLASEEEMPPSQTPGWEPPTDWMKWNPYTLFYHYHMPQGQKSVILGSDLSSDPYLFPEHALIEHAEGNQYRITLLNPSGVIVIHQNKEIIILRKKGESFFLERGNRIALTDKVQFIFDPQPLQEIAP